MRLKRRPSDLLQKQKGVVFRPESESSLLADKEEHQLFADEFTTTDQSEMAGLHCGDSAWARAATEWIRGSEVRDSIEKQRTKVWVFRNSLNEVVGFASLNVTNSIKWPPPDGSRNRLLYIPQIGIDSRFHGKPGDPEWRFSKQIMDHLIYEARMFALEIQSTKPPSKHVDLLFLHVHKDNVAAQKVYERHDFQLLEGFEKNNLYVMAHKLNLEE